MGVEGSPNYYGIPRTFGFDETYIDRIADSEVRLMTDKETGERKYVKKIYEALATKLQYATGLSEQKTFELVEAIIRQYIEDTKKVDQLERDNPELFTYNLVLGGVPRQFKIHILPQGEIILREEGSVGVIGQDFIEGSHLSKLEQEGYNGKTEIEDGSPLRLTADDIHAIDKAIAETANTINLRLGTNFEITHPNVIVRYEAKSGTVVADVTDLANRLIITYKDMYAQYLPSKHPTS